MPPPDHERGRPAEDQATSRTDDEKVKDTVTPAPMTKSDRDNLMRLARMRGKQAKAETVQREKVLLADVEDLLTAEFEARDELWADVVAIAKEAAHEANKIIVDRCKDLGIPKKYAPSLETYWLARSSPLTDPKRRAELRKLAQAKLTALTTTAKTMIDAQTLNIETELLAGGLDTSEARAFLEAMPTAEQLMPALGLDDLGVKHYQPPIDAATQLITPSTTADRRRKVIRQAIEANPGASLREIAQIAGVDHKTVGKYRAESGEPGGEFPSQSGEFPSEAEPIGGDA